MMLALYSLVVWLMQPLVKRKLSHRALTEPVYGERIDERFGEYGAFAVDATRPLIWIHAVSLGETRAAAILLKELRLVIPTMRLLLTNGTATGYQEGAKLLQGGDVQVWQPWDTRGATAAFFSHFKPSVGILLETEVWPNLISSAEDGHVPVVLANARMSDKTLKQTLKLKWLANQTYRSLVKVYAQTAEYAQRLALVGAKVDGVFGNLKFDVTPNTDQLAKAVAFRARLTKPVILFASSREGEEAALLNALQALPDKAFSTSHWLIVPRHPQRFDAVAALIEDAGFSVVRRSHNPDFDKLSPNETPGARSSNGEIWLGDSLGEMVFYCRLASVSLLGGSFEKLGGQNLIEILASGCPVVMGPHMFNFEEAAAMAATAGVAFKANDLPSAITLGLELGTQNSFDGQRASDFVTKHRGAAKKTAAAILALLPRI